MLQSVDSCKETTFTGTAGKL
uniref:Uncharacterized protein n=1 Tax=Physcomitrium patens TaxID=3218 RepID=A0A7I4EEV5_PHYPA